MAALNLKDIFITINRRKTVEKIPCKFDKTIFIRGLINPDIFLFYMFTTVTSECYNMIVNDIN